MHEDVGKFLAELTLKKIKPVLGEGNPGAKYWIVGEALGEEEEKSGKPFVGPSGYLLNDCLRAAGVERSECFITNVVPFRPPGNSLDRLGEMGVSLEECERWIQTFLSVAKPKRVLALGGTALHALTGQSGITEWRGSPWKMEDTDTYIIPSVHPAAILRMVEKSAKEERESAGGSKYTYGSARLTLVCDVKKAFRKSSLEPLSRVLRVGVGEEGVLDFLERARAADRIAVDVETKGTWPDCMGIAVSPEEAISIPTHADWIAEEVKELLRTHKGIVMQNGAFDCAILGRAGYPVYPIAFDTLIAHHVLWCELPHDLHYLASMYTNEPYWKWMLAEAKKLKNEEMRWEYNARDAAVTLEIGVLLEQELKDSKNLGKLFHKYVMPLHHMVTEIGNRGVLVDQKRLKRLQQVFAWQVEKRTKKFHTYTGTDLNLRSPKQLATYLYTTLHLPKKLKRTSGTVTTDENALNELFKQTKRKELKLILAVREAEKQRGIADAKLDEDGRLRTTYGVAGTETGRLNSKQTVFGTGWNSQNSPPWFRKTIVADPGKVLIEVDLSQAEARIVAWMAVEEGMKEVFRNGRDIHSENAARIFGKLVAEVSQTERYIAKRLVHAFNYGLGPKHASEILQCTPKEAGGYKLSYFAAFPRIEEWHRRLQEQLRTNREFFTPFGRRRVFLGRIGEDTFRKLYAFLPQSTCADYLNHGLLRFREADAEVLLQVHDALLVQCEHGRTETVVRKLKEAIEQPVVIEGDPLVIPLEVKVGNNWGEMKKWQGD